MPEGPEISYMTYYFNKKFKNTILKNIKIKGGRYSRHPVPPLFDVFLKKLPSKIKNILNKGKFIYIKFTDNYNFCIKLNYAHLVEEDFKHSNIEFITNKGSFYIEDLRNFGTISILDDSQLESILNQIGPDLIHDKISFSEYEKVMDKHPKMKIGQFLIEQKYFSGVGNYVRSEVLYEAKISPFRIIKDLTQLEKKTIFKHLNKVLHKAYQLLLKKQQHYPLKVYRQKITPKGEKVISERLEKNRNIYYVPEVQK